ncbi:MAG: ATP-binding protein, partial [Burkholderiales bacterium]
PGSILITANTLRLAEGYVHVKSLGEVPVKGLGAPVEVFEIIGAGPVRSRLQAAAARGLTRFVGRTVEMEALREVLDAAGAGQMQVAAVVGEAGVGKSRLLHEFIHSSHTRGWLVLESNSVSYGKATQYLPVIDFLKHYFKIDGHDDSRTIREKVTGKVLMLDESLQDAIPPVCELLEALPEEHPFRLLQPLRRRQHTVRAVTRLLMCESRVQPVIAKFEDLHWNDTLTLGLLKALIASLPDARILLLVSYRPDFQDEWRTRPHYRQLRVEPLPRASVEELLRALLGSDPKLAGLNEFLIERTGGNPFFLEEIVRTLVETQVLAGVRGEYRLEKPFSSVQVPATVQAVLASRIDRLSPEHKRLLQDAAVIGTDVPFALLQAIAGLPDADLRQRLAALQAAEFIYETRLFPDLEYTFKHALTHEVTYTGLLHV